MVEGRSKQSPTSGRVLGRRRSRWAVGTVAAGSALVVLLFVTSAGYSATRTCLPAPPSINFGTFPYATSMATDLAQGAGAFTTIEKKFCTKISVQYFQTAAPMVSGLSNGQLQFAVYSTPNNVNAAASGLNPLPETIAAVTEGGTGIFAAPKSLEAEYGHGLGALKKLAESGTNVGLVSVGGAASLGVNALLQEAGVDYTKVPFVALGVAGLGTALATGQVKLGYLSIGSANLIASGQVYSVIYSSGKTGYKATGSFPQLALNVLPSTAQQYPQLTQAMVNMALSGLFIIRKDWKNPGAAYSLLTSSYQATTPYSTWPATWRYNVGVCYPTTGLVTNADMVNVAKLMQKYGLVPSTYTIPATGWADPTFVREGYKQYKKPVPKSGVYSDLIGKIPN